jgi:hypothetical protein
MKYYCQYYNQQIYYVWDSSYNQSDIDENLNANFTTLEISEAEREIAVRGEAKVVEGVFTVIPPPTPLAPSAQMLSSIRSLRNRLLQASDWTQVIDNPLTDSKKQEWRNYRQALRDMSDTYTFDDSKVFAIDYFPESPN